MGLTILSPLPGLVRLWQLCPHGCRRGLLSHAAPRLAANAADQGAVIFQTKTWKSLACWEQRPITGGGRTKLAFSDEETLIGQTDGNPMEIIGTSKIKALEANGD